MENYKKNKNEKNVNLLLQNNNINLNTKKTKQGIIVIKNISNRKNNKLLSKNLFSVHKEVLNKNQRIAKFKKIFKLLDNDGDNLISSSFINISNLPTNLKNLLNPILYKLKYLNKTLTESEFIYACEKYFNNLNDIHKEKLFTKENNNELFHKKIYEEFYKPKFNNYFDYLSTKMKNNNHTNRSYSLFNSFIETHNDENNNYNFTKLNDNTYKNTSKNIKIDKMQNIKICRSQNNKRKNNYREIYYNSFCHPNFNFSSILRGNPNLNYSKCREVKGYS